MGTLLSMDATNFADRIKIVAVLCLLMVGIEILDIMSGDYLLHYGILPRHLDALPGIVAAPFLHGDWAHLFNNLMGLAVLGFLCLLRGARYFLKASLIIILLTGALVWLFGRESFHIGASGWVFGLWSLNIALAWFDRSWKSFAIAFFVIFFYGGMIFGVLPTNPYISYEAHLFGAISGVVAARMLSRQPINQTLPEPTLKFPAR